MISALRNPCPQRYLGTSKSPIHHCPTLGSPGPASARREARYAPPRRGGRLGSAAAAKINRQGAELWVPIEDSLAVILRRAFRLRPSRLQKGRQCAIVAIGHPTASATPGCACLLPPLCLGANFGLLLCCAKGARSVRSRSPGSPLPTLTLSQCVNRPLHSQEIEQCSMHSAMKNPNDSNGN
jgi:hypothetical protein